MANASNEKSVDPTNGQFIDPLFAIIIGAAVTSTFVIWADQGWPENTEFGLSIVALGFFNVLTSWWGYHKSVIEKPIRSSLRFIFTILLLPLYLFSILLYGGAFIYVAAIYWMIFTIWSIWEMIKWREYTSKSERENNYKKTFIRIFVRNVYNWIILAVFVLHILYEYVDDFSIYVDAGLGTKFNYLSVTLIFVAMLILRGGKAAPEQQQSAFAKVISGLNELLFGPEK